MKDETPASWCSEVHSKQLSEKDTENDGELCEYADG